MVLKPKFFIFITGVFLLLLLTSGGGKGDEKSDKEASKNKCTIDREQDAQIFFDWSRVPFTRNVACNLSFGNISFPFYSSNISLNSGAQNLNDPNRFFCIVRVTAYCPDRRNPNDYDKEYILSEQGNTTIKIPYGFDFLISIEYYEECTICYPSQFYNGNSKRTLYVYDRTFTSSFTTSGFSVIQAQMQVRGAVDTGC